MSPSTMARLRDPVELHRLDGGRSTRPVAVGDFDTIGPLSRSPLPHRHTFYELILVTAGRGTHVLDFVHQPLRPPHLAVVTPGQVHYWREVTGLRGRIALFTDAFLAEYPADRDLWQRLAGHPWLRLADTEAADFDALFRQMATAGDDPGIQRAYLHLLLLRADRVCPVGRPAPAATGRAAGVVARFRELIAVHACGERAVAWYADRLAVSTSYLSEVVRQVAGTSPGAMIRQARVAEAQRLLGGGDLTITRIGQLLGFADPAYFCRFFRRETGMTPGGFRRSVENTRFPEFSPSTGIDRLLRVDVGTAAPRPAVRTE